MTKAPVYIAIILFLCTAGLYSAEIIDTKDSTLMLKLTPKERGFVVLATFGIGYAVNAAPAVALGIEIPFTKSHWVSFELYEHYWITKFSNDEMKDYSNYRYYFKVSNNYYSQVGLSGVLKVYLNSNKSPFRVSIHTGFMGFSENSTYSGLDFGCSIYYKLSSNSTISFGPRLMFKPPTVTGPNSPSVAPLIVMLNFIHKF